MRTNAGRQPQAGARPGCRLAAVPLPHLGAPQHELCRQPACQAGPQAASSPHPLIHDPLLRRQLPQAPSLPGRPGRGSSGLEQMLSRDGGARLPLAPVTQRSPALFARCASEASSAGAN